MPQPTKPTFDDLVQTHSREIYIYLWRMFQDENQAEDCLQDTFLRAFRAYPRLDSDANTRAWLYKIATNTAYTQLKKHNKFLNNTSALDAEKIGSSNPGAIDSERQLSLIAVKAAVDQLPHKQRSAFLMRKYQGLSYAEIGAAIRSTEESARANVYQALKKLRRQFNES